MGAAVVWLRSAHADRSFVPCLQTLTSAPPQRCCACGPDAYHSPTERARWRRRPKADQMRPQARRILNCRRCLTGASRKLDVMSDCPSYRKRIVGQSESSAKLPYTAEAPTCNPAHHASNFSSARSHTIRCRSFLSRTFLRTSSSSGSSKSNVIFAGWKSFASACVM
jgi:hypothetical protein